MADTPLRELINLADGVTARLDKARALLAVLRATDTSNFNVTVVHEYAQTVQDFVDEARALHLQLWEKVAKAPLAR